VFSHVGILKRGRRRLFQAELPARRKQRDRFADAPLSSLRSLRDVDPDDEVAALPSRQLLKKTPRLGVGFDCLSDVTRQLGNARLRRVSVLGRGGRQAHRRQQPRRLQFRPAPAIDVGPSARGFARRHLDREPVVVETFHEAVDPAEAERFANEVLVRHRLHTGVRLVKDDPHSAAGRVVLSEPGAPFCASSDVEDR